jgi:hypothetical protein
MELHRKNIEKHSTEPMLELSSLIHSKASCCSYKSAYSIQIPRIPLFLSQTNPKTRDPLAEAEDTDSSESEEDGEDLQEVIIRTFSDTCIDISELYGIMI